MTRRCAAKRRRLASAEAEWLRRDSSGGAAGARAWLRSYLDTVVGNLKLTCAALRPNTARYGPMRADAARYGMMRPMRADALSSDPIRCGLLERQREPRPGPKT